MKNYDYGFGFKPISAWGYVGYSILWCIPVVGWIACICAAIGSKKRNVRNFARSVFCGILLAIIAAAVAVGGVILLDTLGVMSLADLKAYVEGILDALKAFPLL